MKGDPTLANLSKPHIAKPPGNLFLITAIHSPGRVALLKSQFLGVVDTYREGYNL